MNQAVTIDGRASVDPWALPELTDHGPKWNEMSTTKKVLHVLVAFVKIVTLLGLLYLFVCSISILSSAFRLLGGKQAGEIFHNNQVLSNPLAGLMIGVLATVLVQSSSTSTSIVVTMVNAELLQVEQAIFIVMGANIGTSVTNTIVAVFHGANRDEFRRAFAAATVHDMFNWLSVIVLLPLEVLVGAISGTGKGYLYWLSYACVGGLERNGTSKGPDFLKKLTKPLTKQIIQLDKKVISQIARQEETNGTIAKHICKVKLVNGTEITEKCKYLFNFDLSDAATGTILLVLSLIVLCLCLICIVKLLRTMLQGSLAKIIRKVVNADFPGVFKHFTGYFAIIIGAVLTFLVQSSSIFTSTLTPLVAVGVLTLDRTYPLTLGANLGTTGTAIIAALASDHISAMQIALCHLFFNISGILVWYPIPYMRKVPINLAKRLGNTTAKYRWFVIFYLLLVFLLVPVVVFALSLAGWPVMVAVGGLFLLFILAIALITLLQNKKPQVLPEKLRTWEGLPEPLRSLEPYDRKVSQAIQGIKKLGKRNLKNQELNTIDKSNNGPIVTKF